MASGMGRSDSPQVKNTDEQDQRTCQLREAKPGSELWTDGLICAFEYVPGHGKSVKPKPHSKIHLQEKAIAEKTKKPFPQHGAVESSLVRAKGNSLAHSTSLMELCDDRVIPSDDIDTHCSQSDRFATVGSNMGSCWIPIGWTRISELVQTVQVDANWASQQFDIMDDEDGLTVAELAAPYWERPGGPIWWCHVAAGHPAINAWLGKAQWLHPAISIALRDESQLISERMKHLFYELGLLEGYCLNYWANPLVIRLSMRMIFLLCSVLGKHKTS